MNDLLKNFFYIHRLTIKKYSILRIIQIINLIKLNLEGSILDVGSKNSPNNISNVLKNKKKFLDKFSNNEDDFKIDLELENKLEKYGEDKFDNILLMNVLEHIYNYENCLKICFFFTKKGGKLVGSTPFLFRYHGSPNDYFRYTKDALEKMLINVGYKEVNVQPICGGIFISFYSNIFLITSKIPLLSNLILTICIFLDWLLSFITKSYAKILPVGYFFTAKK